MRGVVRKALEIFHRVRHREGADLHGFQPRSAGRMLKPLDEDDDLIEEMLTRE